MKDTFYIHTELVQQSISDKDIVALAVYLKLKSSFNKTIFYNWSIPKASKKINVSPQTMLKYIPILLNKGWIRRSGDNMIITSFKKLSGKTKNYIQVPNIGTINNIVLHIRTGVIKKDLSRQKFMIDLHRNRIKTSFRNLRRYNNKYKASGDVNIHTSYRRISTILNVSLSSAHRITKQMTGMGAFNIKTNIHVLKEYTKELMNPMMTNEGLLMVKNKQLIIIKGSIITNL